MLKSQNVFAVRLPEPAQSTPEQRKIILSQDQLAALMAQDAAKIQGREQTPKRQARPGDKTRRDNTRAKIIDFLRKRGTWTPTTIIGEGTGLADTTIRVHTTRMLKEQIIERRKKGMGFFFRLVEGKV